MTQPDHVDESVPVVEVCGECGVLLTQDEINLCYAIDAEECYCFEHA